MASRGSRVLVRSANCVLVKTQFGNIGDQVEFTMPTAGTLTPENFTRKTIVTSGKFCTHFEDGDDITTVKEAWPLREHQHSGKFKTTALEKNSQYYCVIPVNSKELIVTNQELVEGEILELPIGTINFVYGEDYTVNSKAYNTTDVFAVDKQTAILTATASLTLVQCTARTS
jgi:hypothetical protein